MKYLSFEHTGGFISAYRNKKSPKSHPCAGVIFHVDNEGRAVAVESKIEGKWVLYTDPQNICCLKWEIFEQFLKNVEPRS